MKRLLVILVSLLSLLSSCNVQPINVIPYPNKIQYKSGLFDMSYCDVVSSVNLDTLSLTNVKCFADYIKADFRALDAATDRGFVFVKNSSLSDESYIIDVSRKSVYVEASGVGGFNYAIQTLKQMLPNIPCVHIEDAPRFSYRGMHLDEARHFFGIETIKKYLDIMAFHKLNTFHWHLTDDQGWRIEIKKYPELTQIGSIRKGTCIKRNYKTNDGIPYGEDMWYTQEQIREIVNYATQRGIDVIPEIDLPGHMLAALAAYPHLGCKGGPYEVWHRWGVSKDVLCVGNDDMYSFLEDVLSEVCDLFPSKYIHIGGDECPKDSWESCPKCQAKIRELALKDDEKHTAEHYLQSYVMNRVESFLRIKGKTVIGWDEMLEGTPTKSAIIMSWRGEDGGIEAAKLGHGVIMTPTTYCYWDYYQATDVENEPFSIGGYVPVELVYSYEPYHEAMSNDERARILGVQANMWTEYISAPDHLEYMLLPRLAALSEVQWCQSNNKDWERFLGSMDELCESYRKMGYKYADHIFGVRGYLQSCPDDRSAIVTLLTQGDAPIYYTLDGTTPGVNSQLYAGPFEVNETCVLRASASRHGNMTRPFVQQFSFHKGVGRDIVLTNPSRSELSSSTGEGLLDGIRGPAIHKSKEWCSWTATPFEAIIDMTGSTPYSSVEIGYFSNKPSQIFNPLTLSVSTSNDGEIYSEVALLKIQPEGEFEPDGIKSMSVTFPQTAARYVKVKAECLLNVPDWHHYAGRPAHMYIDEVIID